MEELQKAKRERLEQMRKMGIGKFQKVRKREWWHRVCCVFSTRHSAHPVASSLTDPPVASTRIGRTTTLPVPVARTSPLTARRSLPA